MRSPALGTHPVLEEVVWVILHENALVWNI